MSSREDINAVIDALTLDLAATVDFDTATVAAVLLVTAMLKPHLGD